MATIGGIRGEQHWKVSTVDEQRIGPTRPTHEEWQHADELWFAAVDAYEAYAGSKEDMKMAWDELTATTRARGKLI